MRLKLYRVSLGGNIIGSQNGVIVMASDHEEALNLGKPQLNTNGLIYSFLDKRGKYKVTEI